MSVTSTASSLNGAIRPPGAPEPARMSTAARLWAWGWIPSFLIHDGEEAVYIVRHGGLKEFGVFQTTTQCLGGMMFELMIGWLAIVAATRSARPGWTMRIFGALLFGWTLHGVVHLIDAVSGSAYAFGEVTAVPAVVAYGALALGRLYADGLLERRWLPATAIAGAVLGFVLVYGAHQYGSLLG